MVGKFERHRERWWRRRSFQGYNDFYTLIYSLNKHLGSTHYWEEPGKYNISSFLERTRTTLIWSELCTIRPSVEERSILFVGRWQGIRQLCWWMNMRASAEGMAFVLGWLRWIGTERVTWTERMDMSKEEIEER